MAKLTFDYCCFCFDLRLGCLIIGFLNLVGSLALSVLEILDIRDGAYLKSMGFDPFHASTTVIVINAIQLVLTASLFIFSILLLLGVHKHKRSLVRLYLIYCIAFLVLYSLVFFVSLGLGTKSAGYVIKNVLTILLTLYFFLVVRSYYVLSGETQATYNS